MVADPAASDHGGALLLARTLYRAADTVVDAVEERRRLFDVATESGWFGPVADEVALLLGGEVVASWELARQLRIEGDRWARSWADDANERRRESGRAVTGEWWPAAVTVPDPPDFDPIPVIGVPGARR